MRRCVVSLVAYFSLALAVYAQDAVPSEILMRTWLIKNDAANKYGTGFVVEHKGLAYLVTARHMVEGLPTVKASIDVWQDNTWKTVKTVKTLLPKSDAVDIAIFKLDEKIAKPYEVSTIDTGGGMSFGQRVWFLGYPYRIGTQFSVDTKWSGGSPFIKGGVMSAIDAHDKNAIVMYIDGFNNPGFSGGPIVCWDFSLKKYEIIGVVQGYRPESAKIEVNGQPVDTQLMVNSGILIAYSIVHVNEAIAADDTP